MEVEGMASLKMLAAFVLLSTVVAAPAFARVGPSFDCSKASSRIEKTICGSDELARADADLAAAYKALAARLDKPAQEHLAQDEVRWIARRNKECTGTAAMFYDCLKYSYPERIERLKLLGDGPYPFVSTQVVAKSGKMKSVTYNASAAYPQFDGKGVDFTATNKGFAESAAKAVAETVPTPDVDLDREQEWSYEQDFVLHRPPASAISVVITWYSFTGGAHPNGGSTASLVDLRSGKSVGPDGVFVGDWLKALLPIVTASLKKEFEKRPGFDDALEPAKLGKMLRESDRYVYGRDHLTVIFNRYDVGPYVNGDYKVDIAYARLKPLLRADGPLGDR
jgi:uncharacterized protein